MVSPFKDAIEIDTLKIIMFETIRFTQPLAEDVDGYVPWLLNTEKSLSLLERFRTPMGDAKIYKKERETPPQAAQTPSKPSKSASSKRRRTSEAGTAGTPDSSPLDIPDEVMDLQVQVDNSGGTREKQFMDCMVSCICSPLSVPQAGNINVKSFSALFRTAIHFMLSDPDVGITYMGKQYKDWVKK